VQIAIHWVMESLKMKFARFALAVLCIAVSTPVVAACPAEGLVMGAGKAFTSASKSGSASAFLSAASRYADTRSIAMSALGPHRKKLSKAQEGEYVRLAQTFMGRFMAQYSSRFNASGMKVTTCNGNLVTVSANGGRKIIFRVGGGRVQDVNVSSVWLAGQMRSTFVGVLNRNNGSIDALLSYLRG
jgi:ABC-type transporter MlaC component